MNKELENLKNISEKIITPSSGYGMLLVELVLLPAAFFGLISFYATDNVGIILSVVLGILWFIGLFGFTTINPNESIVVTLFGTYIGTVKSNGFYWMNPFYSRNRISLRARNLDGKTLKVNDKEGNPIEIGCVVVWKVEETALAAFAVEDYTHYVSVQSEAAVRHLAVTHSYDHLDDGLDHTHEVTLKDGGDVINNILEEELRERLSLAGINVIEARIAHLAYAPEIAGAMLQRQQAMAVVAARTKIVEGAVGMVELALKKLSDKDIVTFDPETKAKMVSNLLVVLCSEKGASPVVNTGS